MAKMLDGGLRSKRVRTTDTLLWFILDLYVGEKYEPPYPPNSGLSSICFYTKVALE